MRVVVTFKTGPHVEFEISEAALKRHPETMLSVLTADRWTGQEGAPEVQRIEAPEIAEKCWCVGMDKAVVALYARETGDQSFELPAPVELEDFIPIAEWLCLPLGDLSEITYEVGTENGYLARKVRAKLYIKVRENHSRAMTGITEAIEKTPKRKYRFVFLKREDDGEYSYEKKKEPFDRFLPQTELTGDYDPHSGDLLNTRQPLSMEQVARFGTKESAYEWAQCETMRDETVRELEDHGFEASWKMEQVEVSGWFQDGYGDGHDAVHGPRQVLTVTLPAAPGLPRCSE
jgi:hypothetical protein